MAARLAVEVSNLTKLYTTTDGKNGGGVRFATFHIAEGELFTLLGPSGCGKTTTLRAIAGLETPDQGRIAIGGREMFDSDTGRNVALNQREVGMVFQSYAIWPHMTVFENAAYPLRVSRQRRYSRAEILQRTMAVLERVGLAAFAPRSATQLSGGQQQRLALARALAREPRLLLLDEPLSNLDAQLREQMRIELKRVQRETGVTAVYVTHDQTEALAISDRIAVMRDGRIVQIGTPKEIYSRPNSEFVANFVGRSNLLRGVLTQATARDELGFVHTPSGAIACLFSQPMKCRGEVSVLIRPENIIIAKPNGEAASAAHENRLAGKLLRETYLGEANEYLVSIGSAEMLVRGAPCSAVPGDDVSLIFSARDAIALPEGDLEACLPAG
jgi:iron(III) transport system ATP-binding protein